MASLAFQCCVTAELGTDGIAKGRKLLTGLPSSKFLYNNFRTSYVVPVNSTKSDDSFSNNSSRAGSNSLSDAENGAAKENLLQEKNKKMKFNEILAFDGPGPESINGRLAMLGFAWGVWVERGSELKIIDQLLLPEEHGLFWFLLTAHIVSWASFFPFFRGMPFHTNSKQGLESALNVETVLGRLAMVGFLALISLEAFIDSPLFYQ